MKLKVYCVQHDIVWENKAANHTRVRALLERAEPAAGSLIILPEMFSTGFSMNVAATNDSVARETQLFLAALAQQFNAYVLGGVVTEGAQGKGRNECVIYTPQGEELARYCKIRPFTLGGEADNYEAGQGTVVFRLNDFTVAPFICYDLRFPEIFRAAARRGAQLYTVIASWPARRVDHWTALLKARAIENQAYVIGVNRCGQDPYLSYTGSSVIFDPSGKVIAEASDQEGALSAELSLPDLLEYRRMLPFLADLHTDYVRSE
jgi:predicted amidohydrolase